VSGNVEDVPVAPIDVPPPSIDAPIAPIDIPVAPIDVPVAPIPEQNGVNYICIDLSDSDSRDSVQSLRIPNAVPSSSTSTEDQEMIDVKPIVLGTDNSKQFLCKHCGNSFEDVEMFDEHICSVW